MSKYDRMRPAVSPANWMKPRSKKTTSLPGAPFEADDISKPPSRYERRTPYSVWVRRSTVMTLRVRSFSWLLVRSGDGHVPEDRRHAAAAVPRHVLTHIGADLQARVRPRNVPKA